jgi:DNA-binding transcriptional LysR family regulator
MLLRHLSYFVTLAREKHYAHAAQACNIAQPTLSAAISKLEDDLQVHLVIRGHRFVGLTADGEKVLSWGQRILADYASLKEGLSGSHRGLAGALRFGVIPAAMPVISFLTARFSVLHPAVTISIQSMSSRTIQQGLDAFEIDGGLTYLENEPVEKVKKIPLYRERYVFMTRRGNRHSERKTMTWADAVQERLCLLSEDMQNRRIIDKIAASVGLRIESAIVSNSFLGICSHLTHGGWSSIVPHTFSHIFGHPADLVTIELIEPAESQSIGLVLSDRDPLSPIASALMSIAMTINIEDDLGLAGFV